jgi:hypothetical protein
VVMWHTWAHVIRSSQNLTVDGLALIREIGFHQLRRISRTIPSNNKYLLRYLFDIALGCHPQCQPGRTMSAFGYGQVQMDSDDETQELTKERGPDTNRDFHGGHSDGHLVAGSQSPANVSLTPASTGVFGAALNGLSRPRDYSDTLQGEAPARLIRDCVMVRTMLSCGQGVVFKTLARSACH